MSDKNETALEILRDLNEACYLEGLIYEVRTSEGLGWDGPRVVKWADATARMKALLELK